MTGSRGIILPNQTLGLIFLLAGLLCAATASGAGLQFGPDLKAEGWKVYTPRGKSPAEFSIEPSGALTITANQAVAFLYREMPDEQKSASSLSWEWRVDKDFAGTDLSRPGADDRPIALHVYFSNEDASLMRRFSGGLGRLFGAPVSGRAITYVWGGRDEPGSLLANPFMNEGEGALIIRRSSLVNSGSWVGETVDLRADHRRAFGANPGPVVAIAVSSDTDDTAAQAVAQIRNLLLEP